MTSPPVIDVGPLLPAEGDPDPATVAAIDAACTDIGFFVATGHGLDRSLDDVFAAVHDLFALPQETKEALAMVDRRGFVPARHLVVDASLHSAPMEYYDVGLTGDNPWPPADRVPGFADVIDGYQSSVLTVTRALLAAIAGALDLRTDFFDQRMTDPECFLRMMHYEPHPPDASGQPPVLTDPHTDYGLITLLATDGVGGLEVRRRDGAWIAVAAPPGSLVVNLGDMLARWTNDRYVSTPHRVHAPAGSDRYSAPFFANPDPSTEVACLPSCVGAERPRRYPPVTASEFLRQRIAEGGYMADAAADS